MANCMPYAGVHSIKHAKQQQRGLPALVQHAELILPVALEGMIEQRIGAGFCNWLAIDKPPTSATAAQCREAQAQWFGTAGRTA